jgi:hypothetical protein
MKIKYPIRCLLVGAAMAAPATGHTAEFVTNVFLRRIHNFALDMNWLPCPIVPRKLWPVVRFKDNRVLVLAAEDSQKQECELMSPTGP